MLATAIAALAFSAVAASAASAHKFIVAGSPIFEGSKEAKGTGGTVEMSWKEVGATIRVECKSTTITDNLEKEGKSSGEIKIEGCKTPEFANCSVANVVYTFHDSLAGVTGALTDEIFRSSELGELFVLSIKAADERACSIHGGYGVDGRYACALPGVETEAVEHEIACKPEGSELTINGAKLTLSYSEKLHLSTGQDWSAS